jgi:hypothetical protein
MNSKNEKITFEFKKKLKERIEKLTEKENIEKIKHLILKNNPELSYTQNSSGVLLFFHNLTDNTYQKLDTYLRKIDTDKIKKFTTLTDDDLITSNLSEKIQINNVRLSSLEKNIIKKKDYYEKLKEENNVDTDVIYKSDDDDMDIFLNKDSPDLPTKQQHTVKSKVQPKPQTKVKTQPKVNKKKS